MWTFTIGIIATLTSITALIVISHKPFWSVDNLIQMKNRLYESNTTLNILENNKKIVETSNYNFNNLNERLSIIENVKSEIKTNSSENIFSWLFTNINSFLSSQMSYIILGVFIIVILRWFSIFLKEYREKQLRDFKKIIENKKVKEVLMNNNKLIKEKTKIILQNCEDLKKKTIEFNNLKK